MPEIGDILYIGSVVLIVVGIIAVAFAHYRTKNTETVIQSLRGDRDDLLKRVERLEVANARLDKEKSAIEEDNRQLHSEVRMLKDMVTNREVITDLVRVMTSHDERVDRQVTDIITNIAQLTSTVAQLQSSVLHLHEDNHEPTK